MHRVAKTPPRPSHAPMQCTLPPILRTFKKSMDKNKMQCSVVDKVVDSVSKKVVECACKDSVNWKLVRPYDTDPAWLPFRKTKTKSPEDAAENDARYLPDDAENVINAAFYCTNVQQCGQDTSNPEEYQKQFRFDKLKDLSECKDCPDNSRTNDVGETCTARAVAVGEVCEYVDDAGEAPQACYADVYKCTETPVWRTSCLCEVG